MFLEVTFFFFFAVGIVGYDPIAFSLIYGHNTHGNKISRTITMVACAFIACLWGLMLFVGGCVIVRHRQEQRRQQQQEKQQRQMGMTRTSRQLHHHGDGVEGKQV